MDELNWSSGYVGYHMVRSRAEPDRFMKRPDYQKLDLREASELQRTMHPGAAEDDTWGNWCVLLRGSSVDMNGATMQGHTGEVVGLL